MAARFSIGIDLGTTNSALAFVPLTGDAYPEALVISQWESPAALTEATTLPSFLYLQENERAVDLHLSPERLVAAARRILHPYSLDVKEIAW